MANESADDRTRLQVESLQEKSLSQMEKGSDETVPLEITSSSSGLSSSSGTESSLDVRRSLGTLHLAIIVFYSVSGGPFGTEEAVRSAGNLFCLVGFLVGPFLWSIPEAAMTAELGSTFPDASGGVAWVEEAFGSQAGWTCGFLGFLSGATDTAIYPILFLDYLLQLFRFEDPHPWIQYAAVSILAMGLSYINYRGLPVVGHLSTAICVVSMSPFIIAVFLGVWKVEPQRWFWLPEISEDVGDNDARSGWISRLSLSGVMWRPFLNNLFWNLNSFDSASSFSAEVDNPASFPRAMSWSVLMVACSYFVPLLIVLGVTDAPQSAWVDGYLATAIAEVNGVWLEGWLIFAAGITNIALFQAEMASDAFQVMGMADRGYLPPIFSTRSQYGTPTYGILLGLSIVLLISVTNLDSIIELLNFNYAMYVNFMRSSCYHWFITNDTHHSRLLTRIYRSLLMEYAAFLKLRISKPEGTKTID